MKNKKNLSDAEQIISTTERKSLKNTDDNYFQCTNQDGTALSMTFFSLIQLIKFCDVNILLYLIVCS